MLEKVRKEKSAFDDPKSPYGRLGLTYLIG